MSKLSIPCCALLLASGLLASSLSAQLLSHPPIDATQAGWYSDFDEVSPGAGSPYTLRVGDFEGRPYRNYFIFDRSGLTYADIESATLDIFLPGDPQLPTYISADPADVGAVFSLYRFDGDLDALQDGSQPGTTFDALAPTGTLFGSASVSETENGLFVLSISLNSLFLDYLNAIDGKFALAGGLANADASPLSDELMFLNTEVTSSGPQLRLEYVAVPEPSTYGLIGAGVLGLLVWRRRASKPARKN